MTDFVVSSFITLCSLLLECGMNFSDFSQLWEYDAIFIFIPTTEAIIFSAISWCCCFLFLRTPLFTNMIDIFCFEGRVLKSCCKAMISRSSMIASEQWEKNQSWKCPFQAILSRIEPTEMCVHFLLLFDLILQPFYWLIYEPEMWCCHTCWTFYFVKEENGEVI